jgi:hypothetical protein
MTRTPEQLEAETRAAEQLMALGRRWRTTHPQRVAVPDPYRPAPRRPAPKPEPIDIIAVARAELSKSEEDREPHEKHRRGNGGLIPPATASP